MFFRYSCFLYAIIVDNWQQITDDNNSGENYSNLQTKAETMKTEQHNETLRNIAKSNLEFAVECIDEYKTADDCFKSYSVNTADTVKETVKGWDADDVKFAIAAFSEFVAEYKEITADFVSITRDGKILDNSGVSWEWQVKQYDVIAGVALQAEFDGFGYVGEKWYGDESLEDTIKNSELFLQLKCCIEENEVDRLNERNGVDSSGYAQ